MSRIRARWSGVFSTDMLNFVFPTPVTVFGSAWARGVTENFSGGMDEQGGYLGLPVLLLLALVAWAFRHVVVYRLLFVMLGIVVLASLGPHLVVGGHARRKFRCSGRS